MEFGHAQWRKSSFSTETEACIEIAYPVDAAMIGIRDSKNLSGGRLTLPHTALHQLMAWAD